MQYQFSLDYSQTNLPVVVYFFVHSLSLLLEIELQVVRAWTCCKEVVSILFKKPDGIVRCNPESLRGFWDNAIPPQTRFCARQSCQVALFCDAIQKSGTFSRRLATKCKIGRVSFFWSFCPEPGKGNRK
jgi:hypothetical protein